MLQCFRFAGSLGKFVTWHVRCETGDSARHPLTPATAHRQRPGTAQGVTFLNLEDETGMVNVLCSPGVWSRHRRLAQSASALVVRGIVQNATGAVTVVADRMGPLSMRVASKSRDFR